MISINTKDPTINNRIDNSEERNHYNEELNLDIKLRVESDSGEILRLKISRFPIIYNDFIQFYLFLLRLCWYNRCIKLCKKVTND